jgi:thioredoxin 1
VLCLGGDELIHHRRHGEYKGGTEISQTRTIFAQKENHEMSELVIEVGDGSWEELVLQSDRPVLVDFWAAWCAPCRMLAPTVDAVAEKYAANARVVKLNVDDNPSVSQRYGIKGIPTLILFKDGKEEERVVGATSKEAISRMIDKHVAGAATA